MLVNDIADPNFDAVFVGSGFATTFFLQRFMKSAPPTARVLVLERGRLNSLEWQRENRRWSDISEKDTIIESGKVKKDWHFAMGFGGGTNGWVANTPRPFPNDFRLRSVYGVGRDWPISYDDIEPHLQEAEEIMQISGPAGYSPQPRSKPFPQPPHNMTIPDRILHEADPKHHLPVSTARARVGTDTRPPCCGTNFCQHCPVGAKFTVIGDMQNLYADPRIEVLLEAEVLAVELAGGVAKGVRFRHKGREQTINASLVALGANGIFNPFLLLKSGDDHPLLGRRLHGEDAIPCEVFLDGVTGFGGSTHTSALNYKLYDGPHRKTAGACIIETWNHGILRTQKGRWREVMHLLLKIEEEPQDYNRVEISSEDPSKPLVHFDGFSEYLKNGMKRARQELQNVLAPLPVERIVFREREAHNGEHIQGTVLAGDDPQDSIVDRHLMHHRYRNLLVLGSSAFTTGPVVNPSLLISALSLWSAEHWSAPSVLPQNHSGANRQTQGQQKDG